MVLGSASACRAALSTWCHGKLLRTSWPALGLARERAHLLSKKARTILERIGLSSRSGTLLKFSLLGVKEGPGKEERECVSGSVSTQGQTALLSLTVPESSPRWSWHPGVHPGPPPTCSPAGIGSTWGLQPWRTLETERTTQTHGSAPKGPVLRLLWAPTSNLGFKLCTAVWRGLKSQTRVIL